MRWGCAVRRTLPEDNLAVELVTEQRAKGMSGLLFRVRVC